MKKAKDMKWIVHPYSYKKSETEISVIHESDFHGLRSYGWFSETKIFIYVDTMYGVAPKEAKAALLVHAEQLCEKMNREKPLPIAKVEKAISEHKQQKERDDKLFKALFPDFDPISAMASCIEKELLSEK